MRFTHLLLLSAFLNLGGAFLHASDITLEGTVGYDIDSDVVTLTADEVHNNEYGGHSGTLKLMLWATNSRYYGGTMTGYILGEYRFSDVLEAGYYFYDVNRTVAYTPPPAGLYYLTLVVSEYSAGEYVIRDYRNFDEPKELGYGSGGGTGGGGTGGGLPNSTALGNDWYSSPLFGDFVVVGSGWNYCDWFGSFYPNVVGSQVWIYTIHWGWCYIDNSAQANSSWWCWIDSYADWAWTTTSYYPSTYLNNVGSWCWYDYTLGDFYNNTTGSYLGDGGGGGGGGGAYIVDYIITNTGGFDAESWAFFTETASNALEQAGYTNFYQYSYTSSEFILRFDMGSTEGAAQLRSALQSLVGNYGGYRIDVQ